MTTVAKERQTVTYSELAGQLTTTYAPNGKPFADLLSDISRKTHAERGALLSAVVVHAGDGLPGDGFFTLAHELGLRFEDREAFWDSEIAKVYKAWA